MPTDADVEELTSDARYFLDALEGLGEVGGGRRCGAAAQPRGRPVSRPRAASAGRLDARAGAGRDRRGPGASRRHLGGGAAATAGASRPAGLGARWTWLPGWKSDRSCSPSSCWRPASPARTRSTSTASSACAAASSTCFRPVTPSRCASSSSATRWSRSAATTRRRSVRRAPSTRRASCPIRERLGQTEQPVGRGPAAGVDGLRVPDLPPPPGLRRRRTRRGVRGRRHVPRADGGELPDAHQRDPDHARRGARVGGAARAAVRRSRHRRRATGIRGAAGAAERSKAIAAELKFGPPGGGRTQEADFSRPRHVACQPVHRVQRPRAGLDRRSPPGARAAGAGRVRRGLAGSRRAHARDRARLPDHRRAGRARRRRPHRRPDGRRRPAVARLPAAGARRCRSTPRPTSSTRTAARRSSGGARPARRFSRIFATSRSATTSCTSTTASARSSGLKQITLGPGEPQQEFMELRYHGDDKLFVPVERLDLVQKYTGAARPPRSTSWAARPGRRPRRASRRPCATWPRSC